ARVVQEVVRADLSIVQKRVAPRRIALPDLKETGVAVVTIGEVGTVLDPTVDDRTAAGGEEEGAEEECRPHHSGRELGQRQHRLTRQLTQQRFGRCRLNRGDGRGRGYLVRDRGIVRCVAAGPRAAVRRSIAPAVARVGGCRCVASVPFPAIAGIPAVAAARRLGCLRSTACILATSRRPFAAMRIACGNTRLVGVVADLTDSRELAEASELARTEFIDGEMEPIYLRQGELVVLECLGDPPARSIEPVRVLGSTAD